MCVNTSNKTRELKIIYGIAIPNVRFDAKSAVPGDSKPALPTCEMGGGINFFKLYFTVTVIAFSRN